MMANLFAMRSFKTVSRMSFYGRQTDNLPIFHLCMCEQGSLGFFTVQLFTVISRILFDLKSRLFTNHSLSFRLGPAISLDLVSKFSFKHFLKLRSLKLLKSLLHLENYSVESLHETLHDVVAVNKSANPYMHRSVCNLEMVGWLVPVTRYAGLAEWLPAWNRNGDVHRNTEPYLHWNALCQSHWVSRSMTNPTSNRYLHIWFKRRDLWFRSSVSSHSSFCTPS